MRAITVTTVSLAPARPPARMLVKVDVDCFLSMIEFCVNDVRHSEERKPTCIYTGIKLSVEGI